MTVFKADNADAAHSLIILWQVTAPGFFKKVKISRTVPVKEAAANAAKLYQSVKEAEAKMKEQQKTAPAKQLIFKPATEGGANRPHPFYL